MSYQQATRIDCEPCKIGLAATITATYAPIGGFANLNDPANPIFNGLIQHPVRSLMLQNLTDATLWFSNDGITDKFPLVPGAFFYDTTSNANTDGGAFLEAKRYWFVKRFETPTAGGVYLTTWFGDTKY